MFVVKLITEPCFRESLHALVRLYEGLARRPRYACHLSRVATNSSSGSQPSAS